MGGVDKLIGCLPSQAHPSNLKKVPKVLPQVTGIPGHLPSLQAGLGHTGLYYDCKEVKLMAPYKGNQTSPIPGRLADQSSVLGRSTSEHSDSGRPDPVPGVDNKSVEI